MMPAAPLPDWADLAVAAYGGTTPHDTALAAPWCLGDEQVAWFSRASWAMAAIVDAWRAQHGGKNPVFWLPDYFCNQSTAGVRARGVTPVFYPVTPDLMPDWDAAEAHATVTPPDIFVGVHFFGHAFDMSPAAAFCRQHGAWLVEDAAHALKPHDRIGTLGDFVFYSPYKYLPIPDGGLLLVRNKQILLPDISPITPSARVWGIKRMVQRILPGVAAQLGQAPLPFDQDPPYAPLPDTPSLSRTARRIIARKLASLDDEQARRQDCWRRWQDAFRAVGRAPSRFELPKTRANPAPYRFVADAGDDARRAFDVLTAAGCPVGTWPDLAPEVRGDPSSHAVTHDLRRRLLLLPVHRPADVTRFSAALA